LEQQHFHEEEFKNIAGRMHWEVIPALWRHLGGDPAMFVNSDDHGQLQCKISSARDGPGLELNPRRRPDRKKSPANDQIRAVYLQRKTQADRQAASNHCFRRAPGVTAASRCHGQRPEQHSGGSSSSNGTDAHQRRAGMMSSSRHAWRRAHFARHERKRHHAQDGGTDRLRKTSPEWRVAQSACGELGEGDARRFC